MASAEKKKILFVTGMESKFEQLIKQRVGFHPENTFILQSHETVIAPFGDLMRDILFSVYQENVKEIFVVGLNKEHTAPSAADAVTKILENKELQKKLQTLNYLFKNCMPEFTENHIEQWLRDESTATDRVRKSVDTIRQHPLMPSDIRIQGFLLDSLTENLREIRVS